VKFDGVTLAHALGEVRRRIADAVARSGRPEDAVTLIGVTKTVPPDTVAAAIALGLMDIGENRVQEAQSKVAAVGRHRARWHMIGHLQTNKVGRALDLFDRIHGVDDIGLARALARRAASTGRRLPVLIEVNVGG